MVRKLGADSPLLSLIPPDTGRKRKLETNPLTHFVLALGPSYSNQWSTQACTLFNYAKIRKNKIKKYIWNLFTFYRYTDR